MSQDLVTIERKPVDLYQRMQTAIARCYSIDEYKEIAKQASAIAAYYEQIKDDETVRKFLQIKLRAWRRIGQILLSVDVSDCVNPLNNEPSVAGQMRKLRDVFANDPAVTEMKDTELRNALNVAALPEDFFETQSDKHASIYSLMNAFSRYERERWEASPEGQAELKAQEKRRQAQEAGDAKVIKDYETQRAEREARKEETDEEVRERMARGVREAIEEVGVTLTRKDRARMREVVFLIRDTLHAELRQAAFDHHMTMQAVLRSGLAMWFAAHGYNVSIGDLDLRAPKDNNSAGERQHDG